MERPTEANDMFCGKELLKIEQESWDLGSDLWWCYQKCEVIHPRTVMRRCLKIIWLSFLLLKKVIVSELKSGIKRPSYLRYLFFPLKDE